MRRIEWKSEDILYEDDNAIIGRLFNAYVSCLISEYLLNEEEIDDLIKSFDNIAPKDFSALFKDLIKSKNQEQTIRRFLTPYFEAIINKREQFYLPSNEDIIEVLDEFIDESN